MTENLLTSLSNLLKRAPFYILFLGVYPVLFLWLANYGKIHSYVVPRSLLISLGFSLLVFLLGSLFFRPLPRAGLVAGLWLLLFFSYGHLFSLIDNASLFGLIVGRHRFLIPLWGVLGITGTFLILRTRSDLLVVTRIINLVSVILTGFVLLQIGLLSLSYDRPLKTLPAVPSPSAASSTENGQVRDVYYILLDGYGRQDLLKNDLELDISPFIAQLEQLGFVIPPCGQSNYIDTALSMAATLNMDYVDNLGFTYQMLATQDREKLLSPIIKNSVVRKKFQQQGYTFITYKSPYLFIDMPDSDIYLDAETAISPGEKLETLNFQQLFINTTFARTGAEWLIENPRDSKNVPAFLVWLISPGSLNPEGSTFVGRNYQQYRQNLFQLENLETIPDIPGKKFIYTHLLVTHQPFTFTRSGEFRTEEKDSYESYKDQIVYVNTRLIGIIEKILEKSAVPPVIILQSDHSYSDGGKRARNFQAYFLPEVNGLNIPDSFTNVNTFRLIFSTYFEKDYPLLKDESFQVDKKYPGYTRSIPASCAEK
jgi:hypothetical protein